MALTANQTILIIHTPVSNEVNFRVNLLSSYFFTLIISKIFSGSSEFVIIKNMAIIVTNLVGDLEETVQMHLWYRC